MTTKLAKNESFFSILKKNREATIASLGSQLDEIRPRLEEADKWVEDAQRRIDQCVESKPSLDKYNDPDYRSLCANRNYYTNQRDSLASEIDEIERKQRNLIALLEAPASTKTHIETIASLTAKDESLSADRDAKKEVTDSLLSKLESLAEKINQEEVAGAKAIASAGKTDNQLDVQSLRAEHGMTSKAIKIAQEELAAIDEARDALEAEIAEAKRMFKIFRRFVADDELSAATVEFLAAAAKVAALSEKREFIVRVSDEQLKQAAELIQAELLGQPK